MKNDLEQIEVQYSETLMSEDLIVFRPGAETERDPFVRAYLLVCDSVCVMCVYCVCMCV